MRHAVVSETWAGIRRTLGTGQQGKAALLTDYIRQMIETMNVAADLDKAGEHRAASLISGTVQDSSGKA
jgi:hypothetical protein